jgi:hypothetical protein
MESLFESYKKMKAVCASCGKTKCDCVNEALSPKQEKIAKLAGDPKKIDAQDLKKLRKEDTDPPFDKPYTTVKTTKDNGAQKARALAKRGMKKQFPIIQGHERFTSIPDKLQAKHFGRADYSEEFSPSEIDEMINEVLSKDAKAGDWISDFMKSDAPQFKGKSPEKLKQMALAAYYSKQRNEEVEINELSINTLTRVKHAANAAASDAIRDGDEAKADKRYNLAGKASNKAEKKYRAAGLKPSGQHQMEEVESIEELNKSTLGSYVKKASFDSAISKKIAADFQHRAKKARSQDMKDANTNISNDYNSKSWKRQDNVNKAVDRLTKEEVEINEANHRDFASVGMMHPDMAKNMTVGDHMDYYKPKTGDKAHGKVVKNDGKDVHIKQTHDSYDPRVAGTIHKFKIGTDMSEAVQKAYIPAYLRKAKGEKPLTMQDLKRKDTISDTENLKKARLGEDAAPYVKTQNYTWGKMKTIHQGSDFSIPLHPEHHEAIAKLDHDQEHNFKDETGRKWNAKREGDKIHFNSGGMTTAVSHQSMKEETMKSFKDFVAEINEVKLADLPSRMIKGRSYGADYEDPEGKEDDESPRAKEPAVKRGRGRPAGAKSGARQLGGASKNGSGADYTGYKLHLPNSNK